MPVIIGLDGKIIPQSQLLPYEDVRFLPANVEKLYNEGLIVIRYYLALRGAENGVTAMVTPFFCVQG